MLLYFLELYHLLFIELKRVLNFKLILLGYCIVCVLYKNEIPHLTVMEYPCHRRSLVCSYCRSNSAVFLRSTMTLSNLFITEVGLFIINLMGSYSEAFSAYPTEALKIIFGYFACLFMLVFFLG